MGDETYVTHAIKNLEKRMATEVFEYNKKLSDVKYFLQQPLSNLHYHLDIDVTDECSYIQIKLFHNLVRIMLLAVKLVRIYIAYEIYVLSRYLEQPRTGHLV